MPNKNQRKRGFPFPLYFARIKQQTASGNGPGILEGFHLNIMHLVNALPGVAAQGLIWGIMAIGVYITFRILDVADLTVDGTMATGGATFIMLTMAGAPMPLAMLGAFLAGMVVGQSDFSARAAAEALPLRDAFAVLFFVSVGMLFDPRALLDDWPLMLLTFAIIVLIKPLTAFTVCRLFRRPPREALAVGLSLGQIGEFSFILAGVGATYGLFGPEVNNAVIPAAILSITLNPLLFPRLERLSRWLEARRPACAESGRVSSRSGRSSQQPFFSTNTVPVFGLLKAISVIPASSKNAPKGFR